MFKKTFWSLAYKMKQDGEEITGRQKSEPGGKLPKKAHSIQCTNLSNFYHSQAGKQKNLNCKENWICMGQQLCFTTSM